jgi:hypothetical protein
MFFLYFADVEGTKRIQLCKSQKKNPPSMKVERESAFAKE